MISSKTKIFWDFPHPAGLSVVKNKKEEVLASIGATRADCESLFLFFLVVGFYIKRSRKSKRLLRTVFDFVEATS
jgi:hypothetical protein